MALGDYNVGSTGQGVADLQKYLRDVGYPLAVDGKFGPETKATVIAFQQARGIRADGIAGPQTLVELSKARAEGWRASVAAVAQQPGAPTLVTTPGEVPILSRPARPPWMGLAILVALAFGAWIFMGRKGS